MTHCRVGLYSYLGGDCVVRTPAPCKATASREAVGHPQCRLNTSPRPPLKVPTARLLLDLQSILPSRRIRIQATHAVAGAEWVHWRSLRERTIDGLARSGLRVELGPRPLASPTGRRSGGLVTLRRSRHDRGSMSTPAYQAHEVLRRQRYVHLALLPRPGTASPRT